MRTTIRSIIYAAAVPFVAFAQHACASAGGGGGAAGAAPASGDVIAATRFSPSLDVQLGEMTRRISGLYVIDFDSGTGPPATSGDLLRVRYTLHLPDGTRAGGTGPDDPPFEFRLGNRQVVAGWEEGLVGMRVNGRRRLIIPPSLGYGPRARGDVPRNSVMVVDLRLIEIAR